MDDVHVWRARAAEADLRIAPFVDGRFMASASEALIDDVDPAAGTVVARFSEGAPEDADKAVAGARQAFDDGRWRRSAPPRRRAIMLAVADAIERRVEALALRDSIETGKPILNAMGEALAAANLFRFYGEAIDKIEDKAPACDGSALALHRREPRGVVAAITPWNFPTAMAALKLAPALAAGNSVVLKPSELASASACLLAEVAVEAGLPEGVLQVVPGRGEIVGAALAAHPLVDLVSFTGSTRTGRTIQGAGNRLRPIMLECGGKSPQIVFPDSPDLAGVAKVVATRIFRNQGQVCSAGSRLIVHKSIAVELTERVAAEAAKFVPGDPLDPAVRFGPLVSAAQRDRVLGYIAAGKSSGARLVCGGSAAPRLGFYVEPTIFADVDPCSAIGREEIFGPVLSVLAFEAEEEAYSLANAVDYGLTATVWTRDLARGWRAARFIRAGRITVNAAMPEGEGAGLAFASEPFGQSGFGVEGGLEGVAPYTALKGVIFHGD